MEIREEVVLEIVDPYINVYPIFANPLAIMQCHKESREWLLCNFIQLCSNSLALNFFDFNYKFCPYLNIQRISKEYLQKMNIDITFFVINSIAAGYYVYLLVRRNKIKAYRFGIEKEREQDTFAHDMLIYGYNLKDKVFYIADNFIDGKYSFQKCTFHELEVAVRSIERRNESRLGFKGNIELIEFYNEEPQCFNLNRVLDSFRDYILSKPTSIWNTMEIRNSYGEKKWYFGLECYEYLVERIRKMNKNNVYIQDFHLLWEHKKHLKRIIGYLVEMNYIIDEVVMLLVDILVRDALRARNLVIKYSISGKETIKERVINIYSQMVGIERKLMISLVNQIEAYKANNKRVSKELAQVHEVRE